MPQSLFFVAGQQSRGKERIRLRWEALEGGVKECYSLVWGRFYALLSQEFPSALHEPSHAAAPRVSVVIQGFIRNLDELNKKFGRPAGSPAGLDAVVRCYRARGLDFLGELDGQFLLAIVDEESDSIIFARDRFGFATAYYAVCDDCALFSSNAKDILELFPELREVNREAIGEYLLFNHVAGTRTMFSRIYQLEPGAVAVVRDGRIGAVSKVWSPRFAPVETAPDDAVRDVERALYEEVGRRSAMDHAGTGLLLSGGIDSSILCSLMCAHTRSSRLGTFSVSFPGFERDEAAYFNHVSERYRTDQTTLAVDNEMYSQNLPRAIWHMEKPLASTNAIPLMLICAEAGRRGYDSLVNGICCDSLFSGCITPTEVSAITARGVAPPDREKLKYTRVANNPQTVGACLSEGTPLTLAERDRILTEELDKGGSDLFKYQQICYYLRTDIYRSIGNFYRMCIPTGIQSQNVFLAKRVSDLIFSLPYEVMNYEGVKKYPIVAIASRIYGDAFARREKIGFSVPNRRWFREDRGLGRYRAMLLEERTVGRSFYDGDSLRKALRWRLEGDGAPLDYLLWSVLNIEIWMRLFIEREQSY